MCVSAQGLLGAGACGCRGPLQAVPERALRVVGNEAKRGTKRGRQESILRDKREGARCENAARSSPGAHGGFHVHHPPGNGRVTRHRRPQWALPLLLPGVTMLFAVCVGFTTVGMLSVSACAMEHVRGGGYPRVAAHRWVIAVGWASQTSPPATTNHEPTNWPCSILCANNSLNSAKRIGSACHRD